MLKLSAALAFLLLMINAAAAQTVTLLALGDSLTAGYGLQPSDAFPVKLEAALKARGHDVKVINAGVAGDTALDGASRLDWALSDDVDAVIVEFGANDALRGPARAAGGTGAGPASGASSRKRSFPCCSPACGHRPISGPTTRRPSTACIRGWPKSTAALLYPFFLDGVAAEVKLNQADGMHPNPAGVDVIVSRILPSVERLLEQAAAK